MGTLPNQRVGHWPRDGHRVKPAAGGTALCWEMAQSSMGKKSIALKGHPTQADTATTFSQATLRVSHTEQ